MQQDFLADYGLYWRGSGNLLKYEEEGDEDKSAKVKMDINSKPVAILAAIVVSQDFHFAALQISFATTI